MTISTTDNRKEYTGNGVTVDFSFPYYFLADTDLVVYLNGVLQTLTTHYTVAGAGNPAGGTVTFLTAPTDTYPVVITRDPPLTQTKDWVENDPDPAEEKEEAFDKITMIVQRLHERIDRSLQLGDADISGADTTIPTPVANSALYWNETADALENGPTLSDTETLADVSADIALLADIQDGTVATSAITNVSSISSNVTTVAANVSSVTAVATNIADVNTVATNIADVNTVVTNLTDIQNAEENAQLAKDYATEAEDVQVETGTYSAPHWAAKAAASAAGVNLPAIQAGDAGKQLLVKGDETGYSLEPISSGKNALINGDLLIWQEGAGPFTTDGYTSDMWVLSVGAGATISVSREGFTLGQTDVPGEPKYFVRLNRTVAGTAGCTFIHKIEGVRAFAGQQVTISFWAKADSSFSVSTDLRQQFGTGGTPSSSVNTIDDDHALTTSWQRFSAVVDVPSISGKTLGTDGNDHLELRFLWSVTEGATGQIDIARVQLEAGGVATDFEVLPEGDVLARCQRFYERVYGNNTAITTASMRTSSTMEGPVFYSVTKRAQPVLTANIATHNLFGFTTESFSSWTVVGNDTHARLVWNDAATPFSVGDSAGIQASSTDYIDVDARY